jgi:hypothetical protein
VRTLGTKREALDFLVNEIAAEAKRENVPLTEVERKMLYFSETDETLPDMASVNVEFDRDYVEPEFEHKIAQLISSILSRIRESDDEEKTNWDDAVAKLDGDDRYILVMIDMALTRDSVTSRGDGFVSRLFQRLTQPPHDRLKLWLMAFVIVFGMLGIGVSWNWLYFHSGPAFRSFSDWFF